MTLGRVAIEFARQYFGPSIHIAAVPLTGGLEARGIAHVIVYRGEKSVGSFVAKPFTAATSREIDIYRLLKTTPNHHRLSPTLLGWRYTGVRQGYAFLEWVSAEAPWPWRNVDCTLLVIEQLAALHRIEPPAALKAALGRWDYER